MTMQRFGISLATGVFACVLGAGPLTAQAPAARKLDVSFNNGLVTIVAENVTLREIMVEWGRKGGSRIVNADKLGGLPIPYVEFTGEPEVAVLRSLLRDVPGYGAAPRLTSTPDVSTIEAVFILASRTVTPTGASGGLSSSSSSSGQPAPLAPQVQQPQQPQPAPRPIEGSPDNEIPPVRPVQGELPPTTPGNPTVNTPPNPNLRTGPGGTVTSTIPGVVIPGPTTPTSPTGRGGGPPNTGRGGGGGGR